MSKGDKMNTEEVNKFVKIQEELGKVILHKRFDSLELLNKRIQEFGITATESMDSENLVQDGLDYSLICGINEDWGYVDIYYLIDNQGMMFITEVYVCDE